MRVSRNPRRGLAARVGPDRQDPGDYGQLRVDDVMHYLVAACSTRSAALRTPSRRWIVTASAVSRLRNLVSV